jgi:hypothetical protein
MEDIEDLLVQIEREINNGKKALFGGGVTIDAEAVFSLVDRIRNSLPDIIREAKYLVASGEKRKADDTARTQSIIMQAQQRANEILSDHNIIKQAENEAAAIRNQVADYRARVLSEIKADIDTLLTETEKTLTDSLAVIKGAKQSNARK